ncbi:MAG TPA: shikimate dehydrogenase [Candidatus Nitrosopolaris sp.]|nr:shikimate dehydrogenase [Candidatus Nitrosopolaris sp.]
MQDSFKTYCIIGDPIDHSLSPVMHNAAFQSVGLNCVYIAFRVPKGELEVSLGSLRATDISGFNVTIPHKVGIMPYIDELDSSAEKANAVNTVHCIGGTFKGYNTDVQGFLEPLHKRRVSFNGMKILLIGSGGAARAIVAALSNEVGISHIIIANRTRKKADELISMASNLGLCANYTGMEYLGELALKSDLIINSTPIGTNDEQSIVDYEHINKDSIVYDIVYSPMRTDLIEQAKNAKATVIYGYEMLLAQGSKAFEIWTGLTAPLEAMKKALFGPFGEPL